VNLWFLNNIMKGRKMRKIIICDDEAEIHLFIELALEKCELEITSAYNGTQALEMIKKAKPDAVIIDYRMPGIDGYETSVEIRKLHQDMPIILLTGVNLDPGVKQEMSKYINEILIKPFARDELVYTLRKVFPDLKNGR
jgi:CheY-like chemotaxis protein